ncbi:MAG: ATP-dependent acyl-CoA ligase [Rubrivivax sp.]
MSIDAAPPLLERTLPALLQRAAARFGERPLLRMLGGAWTHAQAADAVARRAAALQAAGIAAGDRVALMAGNRIETLETVLACGWLGAIAVPINTAAMGPQIGYYLADSGARLLVIEAAYVERLMLAEPGRSALQAVWVLDGLPSSLTPELKGQPWPAAGEAIAPAAVSPADPLAILYTSGTTGPAKGVLCPHAQYEAWGRHSAQVLGVTAADVLCTTLPLFHINALNTFAQALVTGASVVYQPRFSASGFWPAMAAADATVIYLLGAMVPMLLAQPPAAAERAHRVRIGLGPGVPARAGEAFEQRTGVRLLEGYGSTEANFVIATAPDSPRRGVMGWLRPGFEARVADEWDVERPRGEPGELLLRAAEPFAFAAGYFGRAEQTVQAWRNLWFHTGDRVVQEADGAFRFIDRIKDAIRRRGENISSFEVEQVLLSHPAVAGAAVYPVRSELAEDEVMAAVVVRDGAALDPAELLDFCRSRLPRYAIPRYVELMAELPRTENGKVQKYKLRERGVTAATWERPGR